MPDTLSEVVPTECMEVVLQLWDYLDDQLTAEATTSLRAHIAVCPECYAYQVFQRDFLDALASTRRDQRAPWRVKARVLASLAEAGLRTH
ncbi:MAG: zf-HC2 domain-containing protein [Gemmatimonadales bacterium]